MALYDQTNATGMFVPVAQPIDSEIINDNEKLDQDLKQILIRINETFDWHSQAINLKDTGVYNIQEFITGQVYFSNPPTDPLRQASRIAVDFGALPNNAPKSVAHNMRFTNNTTFVCIYATATDQTNLLAFPISMVATTSGNTTDISVDATNVTITTNWNATTYTCMVVLEYIRG